MPQPKYPRFRISQWGDFSNPNATEVALKYGVQIQPSRGSSWAHCATVSGPVIFDTAQEAHNKIQELKKRFDTGAPRPNGRH